ncbi:MAG: response regulator transcription factor [Anaerolineales bacterium]|nr:response regulator transcription factor [Anaerolineales bacterium]
MENQETYLPKYKLLIADDHAVLRKTLALWVSNLYPEMQILEAENGLETLHKCNHQAIDLILLDLKLPDMNGYQVVRRIKETFPQIHIYIMSMYEGESYLREALLAGANGFFSKNTMDEELPLILGRFLESMES